ncbi:TPA: hypothetical protein QCR75_005696 [Bacillus anthracis]|nr:hypothetical protein [Bacillus anthracis]
MKKFVSKLLIFTMIFVMMIPTYVFAAENSFEVDGYTVRVDSPRSGCGDKNNQWHVHVYKGKKMTKSAEVGCENVKDQSESHGKDLSEVPRKTRDKIRKHKEYGKAQKEQAKLDKAMNQIKKEKLDLKKAADILIAAGIVAAATATWFFPGDDAVAWGNFLRVLAS